VHLIDRNDDRGQIAGVTDSPLSPAPSPAPALHTNNSAGIVYMLVSQAMFVANDALTKLLTEGLPVSQVIAIRGLMATLIVAAVTHRAGALLWRHMFASWRVAVRALLEALIVFTFVVALTRIPLGTIIVIIQTTPLLLVASGAFLGESVGWRRWAAVLAGFAGALMVVHPGNAPTDYVWLLVLTVVFMTARDLITRHIHTGIPSGVVTLVSIAVVGLISFAGAFVETWKPVDLMSIVYLLASAALVAGANYAIIRALRLGEMSVVSPFRYSSILWAMVLGFAIWGDVPDAWALAGTLLIVAAGVYSFHREARLRRGGSRAG
jgi:drug/metabolite transporter (DMT)-like permease